MTQMYIAVAIIVAFFAGFVLGIWTDEMAEDPPDSHEECKRKFNELYRILRADIRILEAEIKRLKEKR